MVLPAPKLIAVVDDEEQVRRAIRRLLNSAGYEVDLFADGNAFLESLVVRTPDCVVLDLHMPVSDGFVVLGRLAELKVDVPVVVITGYDTPESRARVDAAHVAGYLRKPVDGQHLIDSIQEASAQGSG